MIFKIQGDFGMSDFVNMLTKLGQYFKFIYTNDNLYIALKDIKEKDNAKIIMNKVFKPIKNYYIKESNETNIMKEDPMVIEWCRDNFVALDKQRYEIEQQDKLHNAWKAMDNMEEILKKEINKNKVN